MISTAILYHSGYGHTKKQAEAVHAGAASVGTAHLIAINAEGNITDADWSTLAAADAIIFGTPTYMGGPSWQFKKVADASSKQWFQENWKDKIAGGFTNASAWSGDKVNTMNQLFTLAMQHSMVWVSLGIKPASTSTATRNDLNRVGAYQGAMAQSDADAGPDVSPPLGDLATATAYGKRVAEAAVRWNK